MFIPYCNWGLVSADTCNQWFGQNRKEHPYDAVPVLPVKMINWQRMKVIYKDEYELERRDQHIENLNLLYVAFTRARQNLVICVPKGNANSIVPALETTIKELFLNKSVDNVQFEEDDTKMLLEISQHSSAECVSPSQATEKDDANEGCVSIEQGSAAEEKEKNPFKINAVTEKIELTLCQNEIKFRQSQNARLFIAALNEEVRAKESDGAPQSQNPIVKQDADFFAKRAAAQRRGTLLHRLMEDIESEKDVERVLQTAVSEGKNSHSRRDWRVEKNVAQSHGTRSGKSLV